MAASASSAKPSRIRSTSATFVNSAAITTVGNRHSVTELANGAQELLDEVAG